MQGRWNKNEGYKRYGQIGHLTTIPHALHRTLRAPLNPFFSKQRIAALEPRIQAIVPRMERRLDEHARSKKPLDIELFFSAVTMDVVSEYAMGKSYGNLEMEDFNKHYHGMIPRMGGVFCLSKQLFGYQAYSNPCRRTGSAGWSQEWQASKTSGYSASWKLGAFYLFLKRLHLRNKPVILTNLRRSSTLSFRTLSFQQPIGQFDI
jgi:Cytochrome P450